MKEYLDRKLIIVLSVSLIIAMATISLGSLGVLTGTFLIALICILNYGFNPLYFLFIFILIGNYSLTWGGQFLGIPVPNDLVDDHLTSISNNLGIIMLISLFFSGIKRQRILKLDIWIFIFFILGITMWYVAVDIKAPLEMVGRFVQFFLLYVAVRLTLNTLDRLRLFYVFTISSFFILFLHLTLQLVTGYLNTDTGANSDAISRFIPYFIVLTMMEPNALSKQFLYFSIIMSAFISTFAASRRVLINVLGYFLLHLARFKKGVFYAIPIALLLIIGYEFLPDYTKERLEYSNELIQTEGATSETGLSKLSSGRTDFWIIAFKMIEDHPIIGIGAHNSWKLMEDYGGSRKARTHNFFIEVFADFGLIGFITFLMILFYSTNYLIKAQSIIKKYYYKTGLMTRAFGDEFLFIHVTSFFGYSILYQKMGWVIYALAASIYAIALEIQKRKIEENAYKIAGTTIESNAS